MPAGVVLDTSFLISLADPVRANHDAARQYWKYFKEQSIPLYLSTIVVSEFSSKQEIPSEIRRACVVLPFNWDDALKAAEFDFSLSERKGVSRDALKDDVKIIGQAAAQDAGWLITDDKKSFYRFADEIAKAGRAAFRAIKLEDGFDLSNFEPDGQKIMTFADVSVDEDGDGDSGEHE